MLESDDRQHEETVLPFAQCISKLPSLQRKVLAMYYFENRTLADIAASLGLRKIKTIQILAETCAQLEVPLFDLYNVSTPCALGPSLHPAFHTIEDYRPALRFLILRYPKLRQILDDWSKTSGSHSRKFSRSSPPG
jgi:hypothetical protein